MGQLLRAEGRSRSDAPVGLGPGFRTSDEA